jgi:hypothetical protein
LASDIDEPEQALRLYELYAYEDEFDYKAIDFSFGSSPLSWDCFTVYFLMDSGTQSFFFPPPPKRRRRSPGRLQGRYSG